MAWFGGDKTATVNKERWRPPPLAPGPTLLGGALANAPDTTQARSNAVIEAMKAARRAKARGAAGANPTVPGQPVGGKANAAPMVAVKTLLGL